MGTPIKVLVADDDAPTRILLRAAVSQWGYEVVEAQDGEDAWNILQVQTNPPQLMIVDWLMPRLDGIDLCRRIKAELKIKPYIILLTQLSGTTNIVKGLEAGANEFLSKPFNMAELQSRLGVGRRVVETEGRLAQQALQIKVYELQLKELAAIGQILSAKLEAASGSMDAASKNQLVEVLADVKKMNSILDTLTTEKIIDE